MSMLKKKRNLLMLVFSILTLSACGSEILVIGGMLGAGAGTYYYIDQELVTDYNAPIERVWSACEKTVADMRGKEVEPNREIGAGTIQAIINDDRVKFKVSYKARDLTTVGIRVGLLGNKTSAQLIHDKIQENLAVK
jgi:hypothetical protein